VVSCFRGQGRKKGGGEGESHGRCGRKDDDEKRSMSKIDRWSGGASGGAGRKEREGEFLQTRAKADYLVTGNKKRKKGEFTIPDMP